ncbi:class I SAM-dependent methyltransferase [Ornithinimicrobium ciconiae]|uniref:Class I SAM-dependent methyltransferase n=2 Tax=Ornithinimicrobium ciconiae TaxID=2594265 RepID=A0A516G690_9MICO|nr:class I SAM-dependent methyltransferase [Ornithinimicrobium ciconiae]
MSGDRAEARRGKNVGMRDPGLFESIAASYRAARPDYPSELYDTLVQQGVIGPGRRVLEIGAGTGEATGELVRRGGAVFAVEPGPELAARLRQACPEASVLVSQIEDVDLAAHRFDSVVAATSMHWVDLPTVLPRLGQALEQGGLLAVWRTVFGDPRVQTPFRRAVDEIVAGRDETIPRTDPLEPRPTVAELEAGSRFRLVRTWEWPWQTDLDATQIRALFATFSDWQDQAELDAVQAAAAAQPGPVTEHYVTILHLLRSTTGET